MKDDQDLYEILGVEKTATPAQIKNAYRKKVKAHHPDAGGNADDFRPVQQAFDVLIDPERRAYYDRTGMVEDITAQATQALAEVFDRVIERAGEYTDWRQVAQDSITELLDAANQAKGDAEDDLLKYNRARRRMKRRGGGNDVFLMVLERKIAAVQPTLKKAKLHIAVWTRAKELLEDYESFVEPVPTRGNGPDGMRVEIAWVGMPPGRSPGGYRF